MARGIDFKGVNLVINYDFPPSAISYVHRIGKYFEINRLHILKTLHKNSKLLTHTVLNRSYW